MFKKFVTCKLKLCLLLCSCLLNKALGQQSVNFTPLTTKEGLSSNTISTIIKDHYGLMWFGTADGLDRFDGTNVTVYRHNAHDTTSLPTNEINTLMEDRSGRIWVGSSGGGVAYYDRKLNSFVRYKADGSWPDMRTNTVRTYYQDHFDNLWVAAYSGLRSINLKTGKTTVRDLNAPGNPPDDQVVLCLFEDSYHRMWVGTTKGLYLLNWKNNHFQRFIHKDSDSSSLLSNVVKEVAEDKAGNLWVGTTDGLNLLTSNKGKLGFKAVGEHINGLGHNYITAIAPSAGNQLWLGTNDGVVTFDVKNNKVNFLKPDKRNIFSLSNKSVTCIFVDRDSIYWIGTSRGGINKFDRNLTLFNLAKSNAFDKNGLSEPVVTSFAEDDKHNIFIGTDGGGLHLFDRKSRLFSHYDIKVLNHSFPNLSILALEQDKAGNLWLGTFGTGVFYFNPKNGKSRQYLAGNTTADLSKNDVFCIKEDRKGNIWIGTNGSGVDVLNTSTQRFTRFTKTPTKPGEIKLPLNGFMRAITEDNNGDIWMASFGTGLAIYHPTNGKFTVYNKSNSNLKEDAILSIYHDHRGQTWVGTNGAGISLYNAQTHQFTSYEEKDGLANGFVYKILEDKQGIIWLSTNKGISSFNPKTGKFKNFLVDNGLQNGSFVVGSGLCTSNGELFFGGQEGFNYFQPASLPASKTTPKALLTELKVANNVVIPAEDGPINTQIGVAKEIRLAYGQNFSISYVGVDYTTPHQNQYAYKLSGYDNNWNYVRSATTAYYTNIDPGDYVFQVRAGNNEGNWTNNGATIHIKVLPPLWRTIYAYILYLICFVGALFYIRHRGIMKIKRQFTAEQEKEQARLLLEQERREAEQLHELDLLKIKFLTNLSHEFRTPISLILAPADKLMNISRDTAVSGQVQMIRRNAKRLLNLVNQLLDFRKMEEHELKLNLSPGDLVAFVREAADSFQDLSERKKIHLEVISDMDRLFAVFDHDKIERIIFNLLSNAFKFTHQGGMITITLELNTDSESDMKDLRLTIADTGIGIPIEQQARIFERFFQHSSPDSILNQGSGIGLSITKEFVEMHGGEIDVESKPGKGATFTINLPVITSGQMEPDLTVNDDDNTEPETQQLRTANHLAASNNDIISVLIVEDNEDFRFYLKDNLKVHYQIIEAANGKEGWQKALSCHPQLIVSDISMPYMDGIELSRKLKADKRTSHIPVILLTATAGEQGQLIGLETGANDYLVKPFNFEILNAKIKNLLLLNQKFKDVYSKQLQMIAPDIQIESTDAKLLTTIVRYIDEKLIDPELSVEDLSKHVGMSRGSLYHKLLELTGLSPVEYIRSVKLERAATLLEKSDYNVAQIAYMTGFGTPSYFSRMFKAKFTVLPSEYLTMKRKDARSRLETLNGMK